MAITTWGVNNMERVLTDGFVLIAYWTCTAMQDGKSYQVYGSQPFPYDPSQPDFVPYDQLTEPLVVGWVQAAMGPEKVAEQEATAVAQLQQVLNPTTAVGAPWIPPFPPNTILPTP